MADAGLVPQAIVFAFGTVALGGPEALRILRQFAGRSPAVDVTICAVLISLATVLLLGTMLLTRFVRKAHAGGAGAAAAPGTDLFAQVTATVSVGAAFLVTTCLLVVPDGGLGAVRLPIEFAAKNPVVVTVLAICAAAAAVHLRVRFFRGAGSAAGPATPTKAVVFLAAMSSSLVASFVALGGCMVTLPVGVAIVTVASTMLLVRRCSRRERHAAGAGAGAAARTS